MIIDCHAHILPEVDHGCKNLDTAERQLKSAKEAGIDLIASTSHFYPDKELLDTFLNRRSQGYNKLQSLGIALPRVIVGAEATVCIGLHKLEGLEKLCIGNTGCLLLEMPFIKWNADYIETVKAIRDELKLTPIMAHIDRYPVPEVEKLLKLGLCCQVNAESICRFTQRRQIFKWIDAGHVFALGSDIHGTEPGYADFVKAKKLLGDRFDVIMRKSEEILGVHTAMK